MSEQTVPSLTPPSQATVAPPSEPRRTEGGISGGMTAFSLAIAVLAFSAPLVVVTGYLPPALAAGGQGATFGFVLTTVILLVFSVGYLTLARHIPIVGGFYAYISAGLGKTAGLGAATLSAVSYLIILAGVYAFLGITVRDVITSNGGPETPWLLWSALGWAVIAVLGHFKVDLSVKVMAVAMAIEVTVVLIFSAAVLGQGGTEGLYASPFSPAEFSEGDIPVTLLFAIMVYLGFEATTLYRAEARDPERTIPRATYASVAFIGVLYILAIYAMTMAYGSDAVTKAGEDAAGMFSDASETFVGSTFERIAMIFSISSILAALLSIHNVAARYLFNLASDHALPSAIGKAHPRHGSPYLASACVTGLIAVVTLPFVLGGATPETLYVQFAGLGSLGVIFLMGLVSLTVVVWFARNRARVHVHPAKSFLAPAVSTVVIGYIVVFSLLHFDLVVGGEPGQNTALMLVLLAGLLAGVAYAVYLRRFKPAIYARLGGERRA